MKSLFISVVSVGANMSGLPYGYALFTIVDILLSVVIGTHTFSFVG
jgi:hypothetical protein